MEQINKATLDFLSDLRKNNNRDWFHENRTRYIEAKSNYESFIQAVIEKITVFDPILKGLEASSCTYRINRDIRFSNDKTLYKTHIGAFIVRGGKQNGDRYAGYYIHVEPGNNSMIAGGAYMPPAPWLTMIREKIDEQGDKLRKIIGNKEFMNFFGDLEGEKLKTAPKGFPKDHPFVELLKMKSYLVTRLVPDKQVTGTDFLDLIIRGAKIMKPLNDFLNDF